MFRFFFPDFNFNPQGRCDINIRNNRNQTPLQLAVTQGHIDLVQLLVAEGADVNMEDEDGDTAMHVALLRPQLANIVLSPSVGTSSTEEGSEGCSSTSLYCRVRTNKEAQGEVACS